jgi:hypothetical protein
MTAYRVLLADALTDTTLGEFDLAGVKLETRLGAAGSLQGSIPIAPGDKATGARIAAIKSAGATAVYAYRGGVPWWGGLLWNKDRASSEKGVPSVEISAGTFESYLDRVELETDLVPLTADQLLLAGSFLDHMQADPHANMRIVYDATLRSGQVRDRVLYLAAARPSYLKMLAELAGLDGGFEYAIQILTDPTTGARTRQMRMGYPTLTTGVTHRISKPGAILSYAWPEDASRGATSLMSTGSSAVSSVHTDTARLAAGWPRLDMTTSYPSITDPAVLETHAAADLALARVPVSVPKVRVLLDAVDLTPQSIGDSVRITIQDELFPDGIDATYRLVGMAVEPREKGRPETCDLILN